MSQEQVDRLTNYILSMHEFKEVMAKVSECRVYQSMTTNRYLEVLAIITEDLSHILCKYISMYCKHNNNVKIGRDQIRNLCTQLGITNDRMADIVIARIADDHVAMPDRVLGEAGVKLRKCSEAIGEKATGENAKALLTKVKDKCKQGLENIAGKPPVGPY